MAITKLNNEAFAVYSYLTSLHDIWILFVIQNHSIRINIKKIAYFLK